MIADVLKILSGASDDMLATPLAKECQEFLKEEHSSAEEIRFLRDLRDKAVHCGGASAFVMQVFASVLNSFPEESVDDMRARRAELEKLMR